MNELSRRYLYIDESGTPYLNDTRCPFLILTGISMGGFSNSHSIYHLDNIFKKHNIDYRQNFHAVDIFEPIENKDGKLHANYVKDDKDAKNLAIEIASFINNFPLHINIYFIKKEDFLESLGLTVNKLNSASLSKHQKKEINFLPYSYAITKMIYNFVNFNEWKGIKKSSLVGSKEAINKDTSRKKGDVGSIIFETRPENSLIVDMLEKINNFENFASEEIQECAKRTKENIASIEFSNKNACYPGIALADIISFALHQRHARKISKFKSRGIETLLGVIDAKSRVKKGGKITLKDIKKYLTKETLNKISKI